MKNIILMSDSYKYSHYLQYPDNTTYLHSYLESRGSDEKDLKKVVKFFGLQYIIKKYLTIQITEEMVKEAKEILLAHGEPFNYDGWMEIVTKHNGYLPIKIRAVKEGTVVPHKNVLMTIESTDESLSWVVGFIETLLLKVWYPTTVCTLSYNIYELIKYYMEKTNDDLVKLPFMLHDFGYRGASSEESASIGGLAHLLNFSGTDTVGALMYGKKYYNANMPGYSIPATEHSTITSWGQGEQSEINAYKNVIAKFATDYPIFACVSDSFDFLKAVDIWGELKDEIIKCNSTLVIRPDSGDATQNVLDALGKLEKTFGYEINSKGYKVLKNVALIQGDGVDLELIHTILKVMKENKYSATNIAFGMGGALLQGNLTSSVNRDTHKFAIKCSAIRRGGNLYDVYKDPITDSGKKSKKGRLDLIKDEQGNYKTIKLDDSISIGSHHEQSELVTYYENGKVFCNYNFEDLKM